MAGLLLGAGVAVLRAVAQGRLLSAIALGGVGYSAVNSAGYYAESGDWPVVIMFAGVVAATAVSVRLVLRSRPDRTATATGIDLLRPDDQQQVGQADTRADVGR